MASKAQNGFYRYTDQHYGQAVTSNMKKYATLNTKLANMMSRKSFLIQCRRKGVFPAHITNSFKCVHSLLEENSPYLYQLSRHITKFKKSVLSIEIKHTFHKINLLNKQIEECKQQIALDTSKEIYGTFTFSQEQAYHSILQRKTTSTSKKLASIVARTACLHTKTPGLKDQALFNATDQEIPPETSILLSLGPKFSLPYTDVNKLPIYHLIADLESILHTNPDRQIQNQNRCQITNIIQNHINTMEKRKSTDQLTQFCTTAISTTKQFLATHPNIRVMPADKGNRTVIMNSDTYQMKMNELLKDANTYKQIARDPTAKNQSHNNNIVQRLFDLKLIDNKTFHSLKTTTATCPRIYGQPKVHKTNIPLRPVVPNITAPTYTLSKYISKILRASIQNQYNIPDSFAFCNYINSVTLPPDYVMISLDVIALFPSIPRELITKGIIDNWQKIKTNTNICLDLFLEIVDFCVNSSYFQFNNKFYQQVNGTAMGSPLSPILAEIVMDTLIETTLETTTIAIPVVKKYVDDLFLAVHQNQTQEVINCFNNYHPSLQFTCEEEKDNTLPYLDMLLIRKADQTIRTQWYAKSIASGRLLNFHSFHPLSQKINTVINFITRVDRLSTDYSNEQKYNIVAKHLKNNDYSRSLTNRCWNRYKHKPTAPSTNNVQANTIYRPFPHIDKLSPRIAQYLKKDYSQIRLAYSTKYNVGTLLPPVKDTIPHKLKHNVIYKIPCQDCTSSYIGMTTTHLKTRLSGHQTTINKLNKLIETGHTGTDREILDLREKTALIAHCIDKQHKFDLTSTKIIDHSYKRSSLAILEMCHIYNTPDAVNKRTDVDGLNNIYAGILLSSRNKNKNTPKPP